MGRVDGMEEQFQKKYSVEIRSLGVSILHAPVAANFS